MRKLIALIATATVALGATYTDIEAAFGFSTGASDNWTALKAMESALATGDTVSDTRTAVYNFVLATSNGISLVNKSNITIYLPNVTFRDATTSYATVHLPRKLFFLQNSHNTSLTFKASSTQDGITAYGFRTVVGQINNKFVTVNTTVTNAAYAVEIGGYQGADEAVYLGNEGWVINTTNYNTHYGVAAWLSSDLTITNVSFGTAAANYGLSRAVYLAACTNITFYSKSIDSRATDAVHLITTSGNDGIHYGSDGIESHAEDMGTTITSFNHALIKVATQSSNDGYWETDPVTNKNITINVVAGNTWPNKLIVVGTYDDEPCAGYFTNLVVSGTYDRRGSIHTDACIQLESESPESGVTKYVDMKLRNFFDLADSPSIDTIFTPASGSAAVWTVVACDSTVNDVAFAYPAFQTYTHIGSCEEVAPPTYPFHGRSALPGRRKVLW